MILNNEEKVIALCNKFSDKNLIKIYLNLISISDYSVTENKSLALSTLNLINNTNYDITVLNRWLSGKKSVPRYICDRIRSFILCFTLDDEFIDKLLSIEC